MKLGHTLYLCLLFGALEVSGFAQAKTSPKPKEETPALPMIDCQRLLSALDTDHDGFVTLDEWNRFFANHDDNKDGRLSADEFQNEAAQTPDKPDYVKAREALFARLDKDKSGTITPSEWPAKEKSFRRLDADGNGSLSLEEFLSTNGRYWNELFENWDSNGDRLLSREEWLDTEESFKRLDRDHNGVIDRFEFYSR
jgi:Ca2+-binding EF-hand superfamily protein